MNNIECSLCLENFYLNINSNSNDCLDICPDRFYQNKILRKCNNCNIKCKLCKSETDCSSCENKYIYFSLKNECLDECPNSYYKKQNEINNLTIKDSQYYCQKCKKGCMTCSNENTCLSCEENYFIYNNNCLEICPDGFYPDYNNKECKVCHSSCKTCKGNFESDCLNCNDNIQLKAGYCKEGQELPSNIISKNEGGIKKFFNIRDCIEFINLVNSKSFFLENNELIAQIEIKLKNFCEIYQKEFIVEWDKSLLLFKHTLVYEDNKNKILIHPDGLKEGLFNIKVKVIFRNSLITNFEENIMILTTKVN
jgi:hypothetical protein